MKILIATHNPSKATQIQALLDDARFEIVTLRDLGITEEVVEDGVTLLENAEKKALFGFEKTGLCTVAEDTGLFIDSLDGEPGIYAARWAGEGASTETTLAYALQRLTGIPLHERTATFKTTAVIIHQDGTRSVCEGSISGVMLENPRTTPQPKMPYSALFQPNGENKVWAEMSTEEENAISHRGQAFRHAHKVLTDKYF
jgi:XTP/dITP diphosphohydrolase